MMRRAHASHDSEQLHSAYQRAIPAMAATLRSYIRQSTEVSRPLLAVTTADCMISTSSPGSCRRCDSEISALTKWREPGSIWREDNKRSACAGLHITCLAVLSLRMRRSIYS